MPTLQEIRSHTFFQCEENLRLYGLYESVHRRYSKAITEFNRKTSSDYLTYPYFAVVSEMYHHASNRVMIVGQEPYTWGGEFGNGGEFNPLVSTNELCNLYDLFVNESSKSGAYWNYCSHLHDISHRGTAFFYFNSVLIGRCGGNGFVDNDIIQPTILSEVIDIVQPSFILFLCGYKYDHIIRRNITREITFQQIDTDFSEKVIAKISGLHVPAIRTYHPGYLYRREDIRRALEQIIFPFL